jgi:transposase
VDFRKSIDGLAALVELDIKVAVFDPVLFVFLNKPGNRVKILYWERNGFCLWLKRLESERFKTSPDASDEAIVLTVQELNWLLDGFDLLRNRPHQVLTPMPLVDDADEEAVAPTPRRGKRKPLSADLPRIEVIHELPEHELICA